MFSALSFTSARYADHRLAVNQAPLYVRRTWLNDDVGDTNE